MNLRLLIDQQDDPRSIRKIGVWLLISFVFNLWWVSGGWTQSWFNAQPPPETADLAPIAVQFLPPPEPNPIVNLPDTTPPQPEPNQIVDLPDTNQEEPEEAKFIAPEANRVPKETISPNIAPPVNALAPAQPQPPTNRHEIVKDRINPEKELNPELKGRTQQTDLLPSDRQPQPEVPKVAMESLMAIAGGETSAQDNKIEEIQTGEFTFLNTKSSLFAQYVIDRTRTILRYMTINFPLTSWRYQDVEGFGNPLEVEALVDEFGEVIDLRVIQKSGSDKLDRLVSSSCRSGLLGQPPPKEAFADDGRLHFVFILHDGWVQAGIR